MITDTFWHLFLMNVYRFDITRACTRTHICFSCHHKHTRTHIKTFRNFLFNMYRFAQYPPPLQHPQFRWVNFAYSRACSNTHTYLQLPSHAHKDTFRALFDIYIYISSPSAPAISFSFANCPLCNSGISHTSLVKETKPIVDLIADVKVRPH